MRTSRSPMTCGEATLLRPRVRARYLFSVKFRDRAFRASTTGRRVLCVLALDQDWDVLQRECVGFAIVRCASFCNACVPLVPARHVCCRVLHVETPHGARHTAGSMLHVVVNPD